MKFSGLHIDIDGGRNELTRSARKLHAHSRSWRKSNQRAGNPKDGLQLKSEIGLQLLPAGDDKWGRRIHFRYAGVIHRAVSVLSNVAQAGGLYAGKARLVASR